ncbi:MAG: hypothetical protein LM590_06015 [Thermofilum sp.]|nr:hypothetical protein [Thermofilum sp.]
MNVFLTHKADLRKFPIILAMFFELLAGGFACYIGANPLVPFFSYALGVMAVYMRRRWLPVALASLGLAIYGVVTLKDEPSALMLVAAVLKCFSFLLRGQLILKSEVHVLMNVVNYLKENPQVFFVLPSMGLLMIAAIKFVFNDSVTADRLAIYAYYQLVGTAAAAFILVFLRPMRKY